VKFKYFSERGFVLPFKIAQKWAIILVGMKILEAKEEDLSSIVRLGKKLADFHHQIDKYYSPSKKIEKSLRKYLLGRFGKKNFKILIAKEKGKIIGFFTGSIERTRGLVAPKKIGNIETAYILEKYRREGIGKRMFDKLIEWFKENKIQHIRLRVDSRNKIGLSAWKKFGFFEFRKEMRFDL